MNASRADEVTLVDFDPEGEAKVVAAALYASTSLPDADLLALARRMSAPEREQVLRAYVGERGNRRHKPGRAFERTAIASTCSPITARSAICSGTGC